MQSGLEFRNFLSRSPHLSRKGLSFVPDDGPHSPLCQGSQKFNLRCCLFSYRRFCPPSSFSGSFHSLGTHIPFSQYDAAMFFSKHPSLFFFAKRVPFRPSEFSSKKGRDFNPSWRPLLRGLCQKTFPSSVRFGWGGPRKDRRSTNKCRSLPLPP